MKRIQVQLDTIDLMVLDDLVKQLRKKKRENVSRAAVVRMLIRNFAKELKAAS